MKLAFLFVLIPSTVLAQAFQRVDKQAEKQELIAKLSSDINKVDHSIEVTKELIKRSSDAPYLADLYFRLAELNVERSRYVYARVMEQLPQGEATLGGDKALEVQIGKRLAIETYDKILSEFPEYKQNDQVRFFKAHEFRELGEFETMIAQYKELIEKYPKSEWSIEARLILGDYHFDKSELAHAEVFYTEILGLPESHLHDMSRFKLAWIKINQDKFPEALKLFEQAVTSGRKQKRGAIGDAKKLNVKREALMAIAWPFTEVKKPHEAPKYFLELAESKVMYIEALKRLANRYFVKTDYSSSALLYREIVALSADVDQNVDFVQRIYDSVRNMSKRDARRWDNAAGDVKAIVDTVARFENSWKFADEEKGQLKKDFELRARDLATRLHVEAKNRRDVETARVAALAYRQYLSLFDNKETKTMQVNRGESLYQAKQYIEAGQQFEEVARTLQPGGEQRDMLFSAINSYGQALTADSNYREKYPTRGGILNLLELLRAREGMKQVGAYYVKTWPKSDKVPDVKFNIAKMFYMQGEYDKAAELFTVFVREHPTHADMEKAGNLALDALHRLEKYDEIAALAAKFVADPNIKNSRFKNEAAQIGESAKKRKVELTVIASGDGEFSERMLEEWEKHKDTKEGEDFLYAAFAKFKSEGNVAGVFDFGGRMIGAYPKSKRIVDVLSTMGSFAVRAGDYDRAAYLFEEFYKRFSREKNANDVLGSAANIHLALGNVERASECFRILRTQGNAQQQRLAHEKLMDIYRDAQAWEDLARVAQTAAQGRPQWLGAVFHLGLAYAEQQKDDLAVRELERAVKLRADGDFDTAAQARAYVTLGRLHQKEFDRLQFRDVASTEQVLGRKLQLLQGIEQIYVQAINTGQGAWGIAALQELARLYNGFGEFIERAPMPDGLSAADRQAYTGQIKQQAQGYAQKGQELVKTCAQKAEQLKVFSAHALACVTGSLEPVVLEAKRHRGSGANDEAYLKELAELRQQLSKTPENLEVLKRVARRAMQAGDFHQARLVLGKAVEVNQRDPAAQNLLGVAAWSLGDPQDAFVAFEQAYRDRNPAAAANLAALFAEYGYAQRSQRFLGEAGNLSGADLSAPDYHPSVRQLLNEAAPTAGGGT